MRSILIAILVLGALAAGCGPGATTPPVASMSPVTPTEPPATGEGPPSRAPSPEASSGEVEPTGQPETTPSAPTAVTQTDTEWGRIWDALPAGFPRYAGSASADDAGPDPVSAAYAITGTDAGEVATWAQTAMETAAYSTEALSGPLEDGQYILDSVGDDGCRIETAITPQGGMILVTVRYGADCPAP